jgi:hypothetical protein
MEYVDIFWNSTAHKSLRTEMDILATTPRRIADLLCVEISDFELMAIRRRIYDTVVLGMGWIVHTRS